MVLKGKETVFVSGGTGKIGQYLVRLLSANNFTVRVLTRGDLNPWQGDSNVTLLKGDFLEKDSIERGIENCSYIFHLATYQNTNDKNRKNFYNINVHATENLMVAGLKAGVKKIVNVSSIMVFESTGKVQRNESWDLRKNLNFDHYASTKLESLRRTRKLISEYSEAPPIVTVFPTAVIDMNDLKSSASGDLPALQRFIWKKVGGGVPGGVLNLIGRGDRILNFASIDDVANGILLAALNGSNGAEYILGGENISAHEYLKAMTRKAGRRLFPVRIPVFLFKLLNWIGKPFNLPPIIGLVANGIAGDAFFSSNNAKSQINYQTRTTIVP